MPASCMFVLANHQLFVPAILLSSVYLSKIPKIFKLKFNIIVLLLVQGVHYEMTKNNLNFSIRISHQ